MTRDLERPEMHRPDQQSARDRRERGKEEADREGGEQRLERRLAEDLRRAATKARFRELMKPRPSGSDVQKTVDRSSSVSLGAWMRAAPSPRSAKRGTKITNAMTMLAIPNSARDEQVRQDEQERESRDLRDCCGADLPCDTARRGPLQISRLGGFHRSQGMDDVDVRQRRGQATSALAEHPDASRERRLQPSMRHLPQAADQSSLTTGFSGRRSPHEALSRHRAEIMSRHAAQLRCLWNGISNSDANHNAKTTASGTAIASMTRKVGIPEPTPRRRTT